MTTARGVQATRLLPAYYTDAARANDGNDVCPWARHVDGEPDPRHASSGGECDASRLPRVSSRRNFGCHPHRISLLQRRTRRARDGAVRQPRPRARDGVEQEGAHGDAHLPHPRRHRYAPSARTRPATSTATCDIFLAVFSIETTTATDRDDRATPHLRRQPPPSPRAHLTSPSTVMSRLNSLPRPPTLPSFPPGARRVHPIGEEYLVKFEVAEDVVYDLRGEPVTDHCGELFLHWGLHREWLDEWMALPDLPPGSVYNDDDTSRPATRTPLPRDGDRSTVVFRRGFPLRFARARFEIPSYFAPLELNFVVVEVSADGEVVYDGPKRPPGSDGGWPAASLRFQSDGARVPEPLGASRALSLGPATGPGWVNFALHSAFASKVTLFLQWTHGDGDAPETMEIALNPTTHKTGDVWHVALPVGSRGAMLPTPAPASVPRVGASDANAGLGHAPAVLYGFKVDGDATRGGWRFHPRLVVLDPRAPSASSRPWAISRIRKPRARRFSARSRTS